MSEMNKLRLPVQLPGDHRLHQTGRCHLHPDGLQRRPSCLLSSFGNATNWKSGGLLASIVLSGNLRSKDPETKAAFDASMKKLKLTKSEIDAVWNPCHLRHEQDLQQCLPRQQRKHPHRRRDRPCPEPGRPDPADGATNPFPLLPSWSNYFSKLNKFQKQLAEVYDIDYIAIPYAQTELDGHPTVSGHGSSLRKTSALSRMGELTVNAVLANEKHKASFCQLMWHCSQLSSPL